jgi:head-tail adaptor
VGWTAGIEAAVNLDQRIIIYVRTVASQDTYGGDVEGTPTTLGTFWAGVQYGAGREFVRVQQIWAETAIVFVLRRQPELSEIKAKDYVTWNGKTWDVTGVLGQGTREPYWYLAAKDHTE